MEDKHKALVGLIEQLHEVNGALSEAARPLDRLSQLDEKQREDLGKRLRAGLERWEEVTREIEQALGLNGTFTRKE